MPFKPGLRALALASQQKHYFTGKPCKYGHVCERISLTGDCIICNRIKNVKRHAADRERSTRVSKAWRIANPDKASALRRSSSAKQRAIFLQATPKWLMKQDYDQIRQIYLEAVETSRQTQKQYVVDHIIPLRGKKVCGLHIPTNLQVITHEDNSIKWNHFEVE